MKHQVPLYLFGTPGPVGGASTKILDLLPLLSRNFDVKLVLGPRELRHKPLIQYLTANSYNFLSRAKFPRKAYGIALAICELDFFSSGQAQRVKDAGLKLVWSNEMMWPFAGESDAVRCGLVDHVLFLSTIQQDAFREMYRGVKQSIVGNYIAPDSFPFIDRHNAPDFSIGRLSRPDPVKYPCNFPLFYEEIGLPHWRFRVQAWSRELARMFSWHKFDNRWEFYFTNQLPSRVFLSRVDLFVYPLGHSFIESWGRVVGEAMLTGSIPLVPSGHGFERIVVSGVSGYICNCFDEFKALARELESDSKKRHNMALKAHEHARYNLFDQTKHEQLWVQVLSV